MPKLAILHYMPLEYYPPVTNFIDYLASIEGDRAMDAVVYTCHNVKDRKPYTPHPTPHTLQATPYNLHPTSYPLHPTPYNLPPTSYKLNPIAYKIHRSPFPKEKDSSIIRLFKYLHFNILTLLKLVLQRPEVLFYYESYSAWPAYIYSRFFNRRCRIFIHNHEYADKKWYTTTMRQVCYYHKLEKKWLYPRAEWISQTNEDRLTMFHNDHPYLKKEQLKVMPNYPPRWWSNKTTTGNNNNGVLKLVYVGSLSFQATYIKEVCEWVIKQNGAVTLDVYAYNLHDEVNVFLQNINSDYVIYHNQGVEYDHQPDILSHYDVGLILYKPHSKNYIYNAPNKLFEYLACNIDVWFSDKLIGPLPYIRVDVYPKVIPVDFEHLEHFEWQKAAEKGTCEYKPSEYFCEEVYGELVRRLGY